MKDQNSIERRRFLKLSSAAVLAGLAGKLTGSQWKEGQSIVEEAARKVGNLPRRKLGYSQREVSVLIGSGDLAPLPIEAGVLCGMNYWHKASKLYAGLPTRGDQCINCGSCVEYCPLNLQIPEKLARAHMMLS